MITLCATQSYFNEFNKMRKIIEKICVAHSTSTQIQNLEDKVRSLEKKQERVELQTEDQVSAELQDTIFLGGDALPPVSDNERCSQVAPEVIRIQLKISLYDDVIVATYRI